MRLIPWGVVHFRKAGFFQVSWGPSPFTFLRFFMLDLGQQLVCHLI